MAGVDPKYGEWIAEYLLRFDDPAATLGRCKQAVEEMKEAFPELEIVRGHVYCPQPWGKRGHWWLKDEEGKIVDPTESQFLCGIYEYEEYREGAPVRVGKCMNCGDDIWDTPERAPQSLCSKECEAAYIAYVKGSVHSS